MPEPPPAPMPPDGDERGADAPGTSPAPRRGIAATLVSRPVTILMLFLTIIGTGLISYMRIPLTLLPRGLSSTWLSISLPYPGAGPAEVEDQLSRPVEEVLRTIPGISQVISFSSENFAQVEVEFSSQTDMDVAYGEVRDRLERVRPELPPEMDRYRIRRFNSNTDLPVMWIGVQYDAEANDPFFPIEKIAVPRIEGVDGVARVGLWGVVDEAVRIFVDMEKSRGYGVDLGQVIRAMQADNFTLPAGKLDDGGRTFALRVDSRFKSVDEIRNYPIGNGRVLADIAEIVRARAYRDSVWRINGRPAVGMDVSRESDENTIAVCERIEAVVEDLRADPRMSGVEFNVFWNQKDAILNAVNGLQSAALWGGLFAVMILWTFLRDLRLTIVASLAIPSSLLAALMAVYFGGQTLNLISLTGFTLGIGMLVDNAVVVIENIARKRALGAGRQEAAAGGAGEVSLAVLAATLTSVVVF
ncbi:MAG: efflux RND transporter permease subunit, partial [Planctomycetota bacterium]